MPTLPGRWEREGGRTNTEFCFSTLSSERVRSMELALSTDESSWRRGGRGGRSEQRSADAAENGRPRCWLLHALTEVEHVKLSEKGANSVG